MRPGCHSLPRDGTGSEAGNRSAAGDVVFPEDRNGKNFRTGVTSMNAEASSVVHTPPVPRGDRDAALGWREEDTRGLAAAPEPPGLSLLPGELVAFVFLARTSLPQGRHLIVPLPSSSSHQQGPRALRNGHGDSGMPVAELLLGNMARAASRQPRTHALTLPSLSAPSLLRIPFCSAFPLFTGHEPDGPARSCSAAQFTRRMRQSHRSSGHRFRACDVCCRP